MKTWAGLLGYKEALKPAQVLGGIFLKVSFRIGPWLSTVRSQCILLS